jgi:4-hydroxy-3-methylbut-2-enyl diphosphate reductase
MRGPLTILGDLVHLPQVLERLRALGISSVRDPAAVRTERVLVTAHGAAESLKGRLAASGLRVADATCPLVTRAHKALEALVAEGRHPVVIGKADHVEVRGLVGDHPGATVLETKADVERLAGHPALGIVAQTTQPIVWVEGLVDLVRRRFPGADVKFADTVCQPTKARQDAVRKLAAAVDAVVVVGGRNSNNTRKLVEELLALGCRAVSVETADQLDAARFAGMTRVGLTAGTSTPPDEIERVAQWLRGHSPRQDAHGSACESVGVEAHVRAPLRVNSPRASSAASAPAPDAPSV